MPSVGFFLQLFVSHLVRMVSVTDQALVSVSLGGLAADAEQVNRGIYSVIMNCPWVIILVILVVYIYTYTPCVS